MKDSTFKVLTNKKIAKNTYEMTMAGDTSHISAPGQFVNIKLDGFYLRRPISVCNGYDTENSGDAPLLVGGGAGVPPMDLLCRELVKMGKKPTVILGFGSADEVFYEEEFKALGADVLVTTVDGTYGIKGFVTDALAGLNPSHFYTCGPEPMLKALYDKTECSGSFSFEERMGCGFGACMGCSCKTKYGNKRICRDGPVLEKEEIIW